MDLSGINFFCLVYLAQKLSSCPEFLSVSVIKWLGIFLPSPRVDAKLVGRRATPSINFSSTNFYTCGETHCESEVSHPRPLLGLQPGPLDPGGDNSVWYSHNCVCSDKSFVCFICRFSQRLRTQELWTGGALVF